MDRKEPVEAAALSLNGLPEGYLVHVLGNPARTYRGPLAKQSGAAHSVHAAAPGQWFIVGMRR
ncbi:hypothetical protein [Bradyrhizobium murdochi]|uniref:hypothetical protein n=1 Tax=Bradyrhizobium murdochi TaxID=1038859 RepID=UPI0004018458|nr:hypothetical protein [Bradyrhizobium murdochi]